MTEPRASLRSSASPTCRGCGLRLELSERLCPECRRTPSFDYEPGPLVVEGAVGIDRYEHVLPLVHDDDLPPIDLPAGGTPLLSVPMDFGGVRVWVKDETRNGTGSHKDRQLAISMRHARAAGHRTSLIVSAGSTGLSHAAYAARCGIDSIVFMSGTHPASRSAPLKMYGSSVIQVDEQIDELIDHVEAVAQQLDLYHTTTGIQYNSYQAEGPRSIAYEIDEQLGGAPAAIVVAVGGGGTLRGIHDGFEFLRQRGLVERVPRMVGVVPRLWNSLQVAYETGVTRQEDVPFIDPGPAQGDAILSKLAHAKPPDAESALFAVRESGGTVLSVTDEDALDSTRWLAERAGVLVEPASGSAVAGLRAYLPQLEPGDDIVLVATGSGYRELPLLADLVDADPGPIAKDGLADAVARIAEERRTR
jgi:threonine synthase